MPILLTTPYSPGDHDPGNTYPRAKVVVMEISTEEKYLRATVSFGDVVSEKWERGLGSRNMIAMVQDEGESTDFTDLMAELTDDGEAIYDASKRLLHEYLQANYSNLAGTVED